MQCIFKGLQPLNWQTTAEFNELGLHVSAGFAGLYANALDDYEVAA